MVASGIVFAVILWRILEEAQGRERPFNRLFARDIAALDADAISRETEAYRRNAGPGTWSVKAVMMYSGR